MHQVMKLVFWAGADRLHLSFLLFVGVFVYSVFVGFVTVEVAIHGQENRRQDMRQDVSVGSPNRGMLPAIELHRHKDPRDINRPEVAL